MYTNNNRFGTSILPLFDSMDDVEAFTLDVCDYKEHRLFAVTSNADDVALEKIERTIVDFLNTVPFNASVPNLGTILTSIAAGVLPREQWPILE